MPSRPGKLLRTGLRVGPAAAVCAGAGGRRQLLFGGGNDDPAFQAAAATPHQVTLRSDGDVRWSRGSSDIIVVILLCVP